MVVATRSGRSRRVSRRQEGRAHRRSTRRLAVGPASDGPSWQSREPVGERCFAIGRPSICRTTASRRRLEKIPCVQQPRADSLRSRFHSGVVAQLEERHNGIVEVRGSRPLGSTTLKRPVRKAGLFHAGRCRWWFAHLERGGSTEWKRSRLAERSCLRGTKPRFDEAPAICMLPTASWGASVPHRADHHGWQQPDIRYP